MTLVSSHKLRCNKSFRFRSRWANMETTKSTPRADGDPQAHVPSAGLTMLRRLAFGHYGLSTAAALRRPLPGNRCWPLAPARFPSFRAAAGLAAGRLASGCGRAATLPAVRPGLAALRMASSANGIDAAAPAGGSPAAKPLVIATHDGTFRMWLRRLRG